MAPVLWSTGGLGLRLLEITAWEILFWRSLFMALTIMGWSALTMRGAMIGNYYRSLKEGFWVLIFFCLSFILYVLSMTNTTVADSLLIQGTAPVFIVVLGRVLLRDRIRPVTVAAVCAVIVGMLIIMIPSLQRGGFSGNVLGLAKAVTFAVGTVAVRHRKSVGLIPAMALAALLTALVAAPMVPSFQIDLRSLLILMYLGTLQVGLGFVLFVSWSGRISSSETGLLVILEAVLGPLWVWVVLGEAPYPLTLAGGAVILSALVFHTLFLNRSAEGGPAPEAVSAPEAGPAPDVTIR
jgi:drug/metabolite transporter (DMT)-like permease